MARLGWVYLGGSSTRAPGTMASFVLQGENFRGSKMVLVDLDEERLEQVAALTRHFAKMQRLDLGVGATANLAEALPDADAVLSSFQPGSFEMRQLDESIPLKHGVIGQETHGPGGFFTALRSVYVVHNFVRAAHLAGFAGYARRGRTVYALPLEDALSLATSRSQIDV